MNENGIGQFLHCILCLEELKNGRNADGLVRKTTSPHVYAWFEVGWTKQGIQIWCARHDCNILHIDFEGAKHKADTTRKKNEQTD